MCSSPQAHGHDGEGEVGETRTAVGHPGLLSIPQPRASHVGVWMSPSRNAQVPGLSFPSSPLPLLQQSSVLKVSRMLIQAWSCQRGIHSLSASLVFASEAKELPLSPSEQTEQKRGWQRGWEEKADFHVSQRAQAIRFVQLPKNKEALTVLAALTSLLSAPEDSV